jgi:hypothetical protein
MKEVDHQPKANDPIISHMAYIGQTPLFIKGQINPKGTLKFNRTKEHTITYQTCQEEAQVGHQVSAL